MGIQDIVTSATSQTSLAQQAAVRVLVVDDSIVIRQLVVKMLESHPSIRVVGTARNGLDALEKIEQLHPNLVTLDVEMPELDGLGTLKILQQRFPRVRVIMCSSYTQRGASVTIDALLAGADDYVTKQHGGKISEGGFDRMKEDLIAKIKQIFDLDRQYQVLKSKPVPPMTARELPVKRPVPKRWNGAARVAPKILAIGVSTGGPTALAEILPSIPAEFPLPIVIVQHMPPLFTQLLAERLTALSKLNVVEGKDGMVLKPGRVILAPGNFHMEVVRSVGGIQIALNQNEQENSCRPAVDVLFRSVAEVYGGAVIATVLTGMGQDGLLGTRILKDLGASILVQDKATSVVWGMPGVIADAQLADAVLPLGQIVPNILKRLYV